VREALDLLLEKYSEQLRFEIQGIFQKGRIPMLSIDDFEPVTMENRSVFVNHYRSYPQTHSDNTFTNMVCWNHYAHYRYASVNGSIILSSTIDGVTRFRPPIGRRDLVLAESYRFDYAVKTLGDRASIATWWQAFAGRGN
jgi:hypothetical protein